MPLAYRTILSLPSSIDLVGLAERQVQSWIESKRKVESHRRVGFLTGEFFEAGTHVLGPGRTLQVARSDRPEDNSRRRLIRYTEENSSGLWQVDVLAIDMSGQASNSVDTLIVEARRIDDPDADGQVDPPHVVRQLLSETTVLDGGTPVTSSSRLVGPSDIDEVLQAIVDPARSVSVIVGAPPSRNGGAQFRRLVDHLTTKTVGTAAVFVLTYDAIFELRRALPDSHMVGVGRVRTFMPRVNLEDPADGRRHRVLGPQTLGKARRGRDRVAGYLQDAFALQTRSAQLATPLSRALTRQWTSLDRELNEIVRAESVRLALARRHDEAEIDSRTRESLVDRVRRLLIRVLQRDVKSPGVEHIDELETRWAGIEAAAEAIHADFVVTERKLGDLRELHSELVEDFEFRGLELADAELRATKLDDENRRLRVRLAEAGDALAFAVSPNDEWEIPEDLTELVLLLDPSSGHKVAERVRFTGDMDALQQVQARDLSGLYLQRCWNFVRALYDYAEAKGVGNLSGNIHSALQNPDYAGFKVPISQHAPVETKQTMDQWASERVFPVPTEVHESGFATMQAHFKAGQSDTFAPRLHYFDDTMGTGRIYIGYIGRHLTNTKTSSV